MGLPEHQVTKEEEVKEQEEYVTMSCLSQVPKQSTHAHEDGFHHLTVELSISLVDRAVAYFCIGFATSFMNFHHVSEVGRDFPQKAY